MRLLLLLRREAAKEAVIDRGSRGRALFFLLSSKHKTIIYACSRVTGEIPLLAPG
jgi:hypothetical protein